MYLILVKDLTFLILMLQTIFSHPQIIGLILDIIGVFCIAKSFIFKTPKDLVSESYGTYHKGKELSYGMSGNLFRSFYRQSVEAKTGFVVMAVGFFAQIIGILSPNFIINYWLGIFTIIVVVCILFILFRVLFKPTRLNNIETKIDKELSKNNE